MALANASFWAFRKLSTSPAFEFGTRSTSASFFLVVSAATMVRLISALIGWGDGAVRWCGSEVVRW